MKPSRRLPVRTLFAATQAAVVFFLASGARADEHFDTLRVKTETFTNVTVTKVSHTDIYFIHSRGMDNAKLKDLDPVLQKHFAYNPATAAAVEEVQAEAKTKYHDQLLRDAPPPRQTDDARPQRQASATGDLVAPQLFARSVRGQHAPDFVVEKWVTGQPDVRGKFVLIDYWATWCGPCRRSIPELNEFYSRFKDRLVVIGVSDESVASILKMTDPHIDYFVASDPQSRMMRTLAITGIPHCILVDPTGIVRYEGMPTFLTDDALKHFLDKYGN